MTFVANKPPTRARPKLASQIVLITSRTPLRASLAAAISHLRDRGPQPQSTLIGRYSQDPIDTDSLTSGFVVNNEGPQAVLQALAERAIHEHQPR
jgi:hypothetical protein